MDPNWAPTSTDGSFIDINYEDLSDPVYIRPTVGPYYEYPQHQFVSSRTSLNFGILNETNSTQSFKSINNNGDVFYGTAS